MNSKSFKSLINTFGFGVVWFLIASFISLFMVKLNFTSSFENVLYVIGLILFTLGVFSGISGNSIALSLQEMGQNISQYLYTSNVKIARLEEQIIYTKLDISYEATSISLIIGGLIGIIVTKII
jgi:hypothetical protein